MMVGNVMGPRRVVTKVIAIIVALHVGTDDGHAQVKKQFVEEQQNATGRTNARLVQSLAVNAHQELGAEYDSVVAQVPQRAVELSNIARQAKSATDTHDIGLYFLKGNEFLIGTAVGVGIALGAPIVLGVVIAATSAATVEAVIDYYSDAGKESIRRNLKTNLEHYRKTAGKVAYEELSATKDPTEFRRKLETQIGAVFGSELDNLPSDQQAIVNSFYNREIAELMKTGFSQLSKHQTLQDDQISQNRKDIAGIARAFTQFADETNTTLESIIENQEELQEGLTALNDRIGNTERGVAFLQDALFSKMTPAEQLVALRKGFGPNLPEPERKELEEKIAIVVNRQEIVEGINKYVKGGEHLANIAKNLGVDPAIVNTANKAVSIGQHAVNALAAFTSGNLLGGISAISNVLGIGGPDIADERHRELMSTLSAMYGKLNIIDEKVDRLLEGQKVIQKNQAIILNSINALAERVQKNHDELTSRIHALHSDVLYNRQLIASEASLHYANCHAVVWNTDGTRVIETAAGRVPTYAQFSRDIFNDKKQDMVDCMEQLRNTREGDLQFRTAVFALQTYQDQPDSNIQAYLVKVYRPALRLLSSPSELDDRTAEERIASLFSPMTTVRGLELKLLAVTAEEVPRFKIPASDLLKVALSVPAVLKHGRYTEDLHYYHLLLNPDGKLRSLRDLYQADKIVMTGRDRLLEALTLTDIAIAQQTMISGDVLLPLIRRALSYRASTDPDKKQLFQDALDLIHNNGVLARNYVLYHLRRDVRSHGNFTAYFTGTIDADEAILRSITGPDWTFRYEMHERSLPDGRKVPQGWSAEFDGVFLPLPSAEALLDGRLFQPDDLHALLATRQRLLEELSTYAIYRDVPEASRKTVTGAFLRYGH